MTLSLALEDWTAWSVANHWRWDIQRDQSGGVDVVHWRSTDNPRQCRKGDVDQYCL